MAKPRDGRSAEVDAWLERLDGLYDNDDLEGARELLAAARKALPGSLDLAEEEAYILREEGRAEEALRGLDGILAVDSRRLSARRLRGGVLMDLGRFREALHVFRELLRPRRGGDGEGGASFLAEIRYQIGLCLDRLEGAEEADREFRKAERLSPQEFPAPVRMRAEEFEALVAQALDSIPERFQSHLSQVALAVRDYPWRKEDDPFLLGLYIGVPRTERAWDSSDPPDQILIFKRNHELLGLGRQQLEEEVRKTVVHEIAHHFGLDEHEMGEYA